MAVTDVAYLKYLPLSDPVTREPLGDIEPEDPALRSAAFIAYEERQTKARTLSNGKTIAHELAHVVFNGDPPKEHVGDRLNILHADPAAESDFVKKRFTLEQRNLLLSGQKYAKQ